MAIRYAPTNIRVQFAVDTTDQLIAGLRNALLAAGWTVSAAVPARCIVNYSGQPNDNNTITIRGTVYRAKITPVNPTDFAIGPTAAATYDNLAAAIEQNDPNLDAARTGTSTSGQLLIYWSVAGESGNGAFAVSSGLANASVAVSPASYGGYEMRSAETPEGLRFRVAFAEDGSGSNRVRIRAGDPVQDAWAPTYCSLSAASQRILDVVACDYQFFTFLLGAPQVTGTEFMAGVPAIRAAVAGSKISNVLNNGGQYEVVTATPHGFADGQFININGASGAPINGVWRITVTSPTSFVLVGSVYQAGYSGGGVAASDRQISRAIWSYGQAGGTHATFRTTLGTDQGGTQGRVWLAYNQFSYEASDAPSALQLVVPKTVGDNTIAYSAGLFANLLEARLAWAPAAAGGYLQHIGDLWSAFLVDKPAPLDLELTAFDTHNWIQYSQFSLASLWLATS